MIQEILDYLTIGLLVLLFGGLGFLAGAIRGITVRPTTEYQVRKRLSIPGADDSPSPDSD